MSSLGKAKVKLKAKPADRRADALMVSFTNKGMFMSKLQLAYVEAGKSAPTVVKVKSGKSETVPGGARSVRVRLMVKKGLAVLSGGYEPLGEQYVVPHDASGEVEFILSGTVHFESVKILKHHWNSPDGDSNGGAAGSQKSNGGLERIQSFTSSNIKVAPKRRLPTRAHAAAPHHIIRGPRDGMPHPP